MSKPIFWSYATSPARSPPSADPNCFSRNPTWRLIIPVVGFRKVDSALVLMLAQCNSLLDAPQGQEPPIPSYQLPRCLRIAKLMIAHLLIHLAHCFLSTVGSGTSPPCFARKGMFRSLVKQKRTNSQSVLTTFRV
jgi:hypothetical protein